MMRTIFSGVAKRLHGPTFVNVGLKRWPREGWLPEYWRFATREERDGKDRWWPQCNGKALYAINVYPRKMEK